MRRKKKPVCSVLFSIALTTLYIRCAFMHSSEPRYRERRHTRSETLLTAHKKTPTCNLLSRWTLPELIDVFAREEVEITIRVSHSLSSASLVDMQAQRWCHCFRAVLVTSMGPDLLWRAEGDSHGSRKSKWKDVRTGNKAPEVHIMSMKEGIYCMIQAVKIPVCQFLCR